MLPSLNVYTRLYRKYTKKGKKTFLKFPSFNEISENVRDKDKVNVNVVVAQRFLCHCLTKWSTKFIWWHNGISLSSSQLTFGLLLMQ